jgi:hypothetical protein
MTCQTRRQTGFCCVAASHPDGLIIEFDESVSYIGGVMKLTHVGIKATRQQPPVVKIVLRDAREDRPKGPWR